MAKAPPTTEPHIERPGPAEFRDPIAWSEIGQNPDALLKSGEGLAEAFNVDAF